MLEAVQLPARVSDLDTGLADVDRDALPHGVVGGVGWGGGGGKWEGRGSFAARRGEYEDAFLCGTRLGFGLLPLGSFYRGGTDSLGHEPTTECRRRNAPLTRGPQCGRARMSKGPVCL